MTPDAPPDAAAPDEGALRGDTPAAGRGRLRTAVETLVVAVAAAVPMLASQPGVVSDDTKTYLYLDPGRYLRQAVSMWDPGVAMGTVTHENVGYLLPMGPFYWAAAELHVPLWVAQRLWMAALLFAAGTGMLLLWRVLGLVGPGRWVAAGAFMFTPYVLQYAGRISVILLPWAGLPWMVAFVILALRRGGWRYPALFALVVALVSGINASSILYVGLAPVLWLPYAVVVRRTATWRQVLGVTWRVGILTVLVSLWWAVGLQIEAAYGINVLKYTETLPATSSTSLASEVLRGLGYWYFYGSDRLGSWTQAAVAYTQNLWLVAASFAVPLLAFVAAVTVRWRHRAYFALLVLVGTVLPVGAYPYTHPSGVGSALKAFMVDTTAGLAMRSTDRATPLVLLALAVFLGAGIDAVAARARWTGRSLAGGALGVIAAANVPLLTGAIIANGFTQPAVPPASVREAAAALDATHPGTRVYALPGNDFAAYRWGDTIDTVYPGLMTRPFVTHEQQIMGSLPTADLLHAVDSPLQNGTEDMAALAPMAALMSAGDVLVQYDQAYERYNTPNPQVLAAAFATTPPGLSDPVSYGPPQANVAGIGTLTEAVLALQPDPSWPSPLVSYTVADPRPVVRAESLGDPLIVDGDAPGIVDSASVGLLAGNPTIFYAGTLDTRAGLAADLLGGPADLVVTDTNRKQAFEWNSLEQNTGLTETLAQGPDTTNPSDAPVDLFPAAPADAQSTTAFTGITSVTASSYGSSLSYLPEDRPSMALDGNLDTAWLSDFTSDPVGQWWQTTLAAPTTIGHLVLVQPQTGSPTRWITRVTVTFDGRHPVTADLGPGSRTAAGQVLTFAPRTFRTLRVTVDATTPVSGAAAGPFPSSVGFAEVGIPGLNVTESVVMPQDLLHLAGTTSLGDRLTLVMTRLRSSGYPPRSAVEPALDRTFWLPTSRTFTLSGQARISTLIPDDMIDRLVGRTGGVVAYSRGRLPGDLAVGAVNTIDGNPSTIWEPGFGTSHQVGAWLQYVLPAPITFDHLDLQVVADGLHTVPTEVTVSTPSGSATVPLPPVAQSTVPGAVVDVPISFPALRGQRIRVTVDAVRPVTTVNYYSEVPSGLPLGIAEVGIPGVHAPALPAAVPSSCRNDLLAVDGTPVWVSISGSTSAALSRQALQVSLCGPDAAGLALGPGTHHLTAVRGHLTGWNLDQLVLDSAPGGGAAAPPGATGMVSPPPAGPAPAVTVLSRHATSMQLRLSGISPTSAPFELVLGESLNAGWTATVAGSGSLGPPVLVDGFANGFRVVPASLGPALHGGTVLVTLRWTPQQRETAALVVSAIAILACVVIGFVPRRRWSALRRAGRGRQRARRRGADAYGTHRQVAGDGAPARPTLAAPFGRTGRRAPVGVAVVAAVVSGGIAAAVALPVVGAPVAAGTLVALLVPRTRTVLGWAAAGLVAAAGTAVVVIQARHHYTANGLWPTHAAVASDLAWAAIVFLCADVAVAAILDRRASPGP